VNPRDSVFYEWQIPAHILSYASLPPLLHLTGCRPWGCRQRAGAGMVAAEQACGCIDSVYPPEKSRGLLRVVEYLGWGREAGGCLMWVKGEG